MVLDPRVDWPAVEHAGTETALDVALRSVQIAVVAEEERDARMPGAGIGGDRVGVVRDADQHAVGVVGEHEQDGDAAQALELGEVGA